MEGDGSLMGSGTRLDTLWRDVFFSDTTFGNVARNLCQGKIAVVSDVMRNEKCLTTVSSHPVRYLVLRE